ncbi:MAG: hypothetical protein E6H04_02545, partial [Bacillati bacterium ANGP1]
MRQKGLVLLLSVVIAVGGILFPSRSRLNLTQGGLRGVMGGWTEAGGRIGPHGLITKDADKPRQPDPTYAALPLSFEANRGQTDPQVRFLARVGRHVFFLTSTETVLVFTPPKGPGRANGQRASRAPGQPEDRLATVLRMRFAGANPTPLVTGVEQLPGKANYLIGNHPANWLTHVPLYARVLYENLYPGIDLRFYGAPRGDQTGAGRAHGGQLEYDFVVHPGADPGIIGLEFQGAQALDVTAQGDLVLHLPGGAMVQQQKPRLYQETDGARRNIVGRFVRKTTHQVGFQVGAYDRRKPLVIDPAYLGYSTYLRGGNDDGGNGIAVDARGNAYVTGDTNPIEFPTTSDRFQRENKGFSEAFVTKLNADGSALIYSTYLGGTMDDTGSAIAADADGNAYVTGTTFSNDFPTTQDAVQPSLRGHSNAFVTKLNADGSALVYSTYLGGSDLDYGYGIAVGPSGSAYVTGGTHSANFPVARAFQRTFGGMEDAFVTKLSADGSTLVYSTYLGGLLQDEGHGVAVSTAPDGSEYAFVTGITASADFALTPATAYQTARNGIQDAFVTVLRPNGAALVYSTYLGGTGLTTASGIAVDGLGKAYITGATTSHNFPVKPNPGAYQAATNGGYDAFVAKVNPSAAGPDSLVYATYLGGTLNDYGSAIAVDGSGNAYVTGYTY